MVTAVEFFTIKKAQAHRPMLFKFAVIIYVKFTLQSSSPTGQNGQSVSSYHHTNNEQLNHQFFHFLLLLSFVKIMTIN